MSRPILSLFLVLGLLAGAMSTHAAVPHAATASQGAAVEVGMYDLVFDPAEVTVTAGDTILVTNYGALPHNWAIEGTSVASPVVDGGDTTGQLVTIPADLEPGTYTVVCEVPGHAQAGMVGTVTVLAPADGDDSQTSDDEGDTPTGQGEDTGRGPELDLDLGDGWEMVNEETIDIGFDDAVGDVPATVLLFHGPDASTARVIVAGVDVANGRPTYDGWQAFIRTVGDGLSPVDADAPSTSGCLFADSVQGTERLTSIPIGSTICLTEDRFIWVSVSGQWEADDEADDEPLAFAAASVALVELVLDQDA